MSGDRFLDEAPQAEAVTDYDRAHATDYLRLLDAETAGATMAEICQIVFGLDAAREPERAHAMYTSHLARAHWLRDHGYRNLL